MGRMIHTTHYASWPGKFPKNFPTVEGGTKRVGTRSFTNTTNMIGREQEEEPNHLNDYF